MIVREVQAKTVLSCSKVFDYTVNPYIGCEHGCTYCYARFMKRYTGHKEPWGEFVDVKINVASCLQQELKKKKPGRIWISETCDVYQPVEEKYELTRSCLESFSKHAWPVTVHTKSPLVIRDLELLKNIRGVDGDSRLLRLMMVLGRFLSLDRQLLRKEFKRWKGCILRA
jgi:DNA repair photolyase